MRAGWWPIIGTLGAVVFTIVACDDPSLNPNQFGPLLHPTSVVGSGAQTKGLTDDTQFGANTNVGGVTGLVNQPDDIGGATPLPNIYTVQATISIGGKAPGNWFDSRPGTSNLEVRLMPLNSRTMSSKDYLLPDGTLRFPNLAYDMYHLVYDDTTSDNKGMLTISPVDSNGRQHIDMVGFYISDAFPLTGYNGGVATMSYDLYWDSDSFPYIYGLNPNGQVTNDPAHPNYTSDSLTTYDMTGNGQFKFKGKEFTLLPPGTQPAPGTLPVDNNQLADYRVVVYSADGLYTIEWVSEWHQPDSNGYVTIPSSAGWDGYSGNAADFPSQLNSTANQPIPDGDYLYAIQFKSQGHPFPENWPNPRDYGLQDRSFISHFYGGSQFFPFHLTRKAKPSNWATPAPSAVPTAAPKASPAASLPPLPGFGG